MKSPVVLPLPFSLPSAAPQPASQAEAGTPQPLWLALVFPRLALEIHEDQQRDLPAVVVREHKGRAVVHTASQLAEAQGVHTEMPVNAAYALCPGLKVYQVNEQAEKNRLQQLALWAEQFTSKVSIQPPQALLLEVRGSLKLFGGLPALQHQIQQQLTEQWRHSFYSAVTPTPMASLLLASSGYIDIINNKADLRSMLGRLSVNNLPIGLKKKQQLRNAGIRQLRDVWRLPREGLARRFGPKLINYLDRVLGLTPDPLALFTSAEEFEAFYDFPMEVHKAELLLNIAGQLLEQLIIFLRQRDACINECRFQLYHDKQSATHVIVGVRQSTRDYPHLFILLEEHLNRLALKAPVKSIKLTAKNFLPFSPRDVSLFTDPALDSQLSAKENNIEMLLEQLQARLGRDAIKTIHSVNDHRPEYAYCYNHTVVKKSKRISGHRPFWLLPEPQLLPQKDNRPWLQGPVMLLKGPERIEAGWWSGTDIRRDYYIAMDSAGSHLWIYRELTGHYQWYLHGLFA